MSEQGRFINKILIYVLVIIKYILICHFPRRGKFNVRSVLNFTTLFVRQITN